MATSIRHRKTRIVTLAVGETLADHCRAGDIALMPDGDFWWTQFVGADAHVDSYDAPFASYNEALWAAKAAAEFNAEHDT